MKGRTVHPAERSAGHQPEQKRFGRDPVRQFAEPGDVAQSQSSLLQLKMAQIFEDDVGHGHAERGGKILFRHGLLPDRVGEKANQACRQIFGIARLVELDCHSFAIRHLAKVFQVRADHGNSVGTG
jgi:hypothetical protein